MKGPARKFELLVTPTAEHPNPAYAVSNDAQATPEPPRHVSPLASPGYSGVRRMRRAVAPTYVDELVELQNDIDGLLHVVTAASVVVCLATTLLF